MTAIDYEALGRWGFKWQGHDHGTHVPMVGGYWTPWHESATAIQTLRTELADRDARLAEAVGLLTYYADTYCEGFGECVGDFCGKLSGDNCGGCPARAFLAKQEPSQ